MYHGYQLKFELYIQALDFICFACVSLSDFCLHGYENLKTRKKIRKKDVTHVNQRRF